jgi:hypothetical protein
LFVDSPVPDQRGDFPLESSDDSDRFRWRQNLVPVLVRVP